MKSTVLCFIVLYLSAAIAGRSPSPLPSTTPTASATPVASGANCENFYPDQDTWFAPGLQNPGGCVSNGGETSAMSGRLAIFGGYINQYGLYRFPFGSFTPRTLNSAVLSLNGNVPAGILHDLWLTNSFNEHNVSTTNGCPPPPVAISYIGTYNTTFAHLRVDDASFLSAAQNALNNANYFPLQVGANANYTINSIQSAFYTKEAGSGLWAQLTLCW